MKRFLAILLMLSLIAAALPAMAEEEEGYWAVVANPIVADRLNLRKRPDTGSESLGRFYSGTPVYVETVVTDKAGREWARVDLTCGYHAGADLTGYMLNEYLMPMNRNYDAPQLFHTAQTAGRSASIRSEPRNSAGTVGFGTVSGTVYVLGDIGDDWRLVGSPDDLVVGYVRTAHLTDQTVRIEDAYLIPRDGSGTVAVYEDKGMKRQIASYYTGAPVRVVDFSRAGGWAAIQGFGLRSSLGGTPDFIGGYVHVEELRVFCFYWQQDLQGVTGIVKEDCRVDSLRQTLARGTAVTVAGEIGDKYQVIFGDAESAMMQSGFVDKDRIELTARPAGLTGPERLGFAKLGSSNERYFEITKLSAPGGKSCGTVYSAGAELIGETDGYLQVRQPRDENFFVPAQGAEIIRNDDLWADGTAMAAPAQWTAAENTQGLWVLENAPGKTVMLEVAEAEEGWRNGVYYGAWHYYAEGEEARQYTVLIPAGAKVRLEGEGSLRPLIRDEGYAIMPECQTRAYGEDEILFSGSGRFFCDAQIPAETTGWYNYQVKPLDGAEDWYAEVTDLFHQSIQREDGSDSDEEGYYFLEVFPGQFLELYNCELKIYYGNG